MTAGPDSWLVRPSDTTEGDFSIFFYCNTAVQRFKIHKSGHQYSMGGRYFDGSVSALNTVFIQIISCFRITFGVIFVVHWFGVGLMIKRSLVRLPAGALSSQLGQLSFPSLQGG